MSREEFESLCDGCGKCCLHKLEDEDTGEVYYTDVACRFLDANTCRCTTYSTREHAGVECIVLTPALASQLPWLPRTCAYRLVAVGKPLPDWHPLLSGNPRSVHTSGMSVAGRVVAESAVDPDDLQEYVVHWV